MTGFLPRHFAILVVLGAAMIGMSCASSPPEARSTGQSACSPRCQQNFRACTRESSPMCVEDLRSCLASCASGDSCSEGCESQRIRCQARGANTVTCDRSFLRCARSCAPTSSRGAQ